jgi:(p)ppGpp synthase/HD superfamily hydrolase
MYMICKAAYWSAEWHKGQFRKWPYGPHREPYADHPARVASIVTREGLWMEDNGMSLLEVEDAIVAAYLHDVVKDTDVNLNTVDAVFSSAVAKLVWELTNQFTPDMCELNRAERKDNEFARLRDCSLRARIIKAIDRIDNLKTLWCSPKGFQKVYYDESLLLFHSLNTHQMSERLQSEVYDIIKKAKPQ